MVGLRSIGDGRTDIESPVRDPQQSDRLAKKLGKLKKLNAVQLLSSNDRNKGFFFNLSVSIFGNSPISQWLTSKNRNRALTRVTGLFLMGFSWGHAHFRFFRVSHCFDKFCRPKFTEKQPKNHQTTTQLTKSAIMEASKTSFQKKNL